MNLIKKIQNLDTKKTVSFLILYLIGNLILIFSYGIESIILIPLTLLFVYLIFMYMISLYFTIISFYYLVIYKMQISWRFLVSTAYCLFIICISIVIEQIQDIIYVASIITLIPAIIGIADKKYLLGLDIAPEYEIKSIIRTLGKIVFLIITVGAFSFLVYKYFIIGF